MRDEVSTRVMATATEGKCRLCGNQYSGRGMSRHLQTCLKRAAPLGHPGSAGAEVFHIAVESAFISDYWLHLQAPASARFADLDDLLRKVWLECCGHLSGFGVRRGTDRSIDMDDRLGNVLEKGFRFSYTYDFGSSTELMLRVIDRYLAPGEHRSIPFWPVMIRRSISVIAESRRLSIVKRRPSNTANPRLCARLASQ